MGVIAGHVEFFLTNAKHLYSSKNVPSALHTVHSYQSQRTNNLMALSQMPKCIRSHTRANFKRNLTYLQVFWSVEGSWSPGAQGEHANYIQMANWIRSELRTSVLQRKSVNRQAIVCLLFF